MTTGSGLIGTVPGDRLDTDYLVVGAGAMGMAFADSLMEHADVHITIVDRRHGPGGHWRDAYPFVRLHQASLFYGVASTVLGDGTIQQTGPEAGLQERAGLAEILAYYDRVLERRMLPSGQVTFLGGWAHHADGDRHVVTSQVSGRQVPVHVRRRVVDAAYLEPTIPATSPAPFAVADDAPVLTINDLESLTDPPSEFVIVGSGKTATDAIIWLLDNAVDPGRIRWVRPRDPWMLNRAMVQPDPAVAVGLAADLMEAASAADSLDDLFARLEAAGVVLRIDAGVTPTMARTPTLATWELDLLRQVTDVIRLGHIRRVDRDRITFEEGEVALAPNAVVVHCAASGLANPPMVPIWQPDRIRLQTSRAGFPCFNAALLGYVEATRDVDAERNRLCPPNLYGNSRPQWARMFALGTTAAGIFGAEEDIAAWADEVALNPSRMTDAQRQQPAVRASTARLEAHAETGLRRLYELGDEPGP